MKRSSLPIYEVEFLPVERRLADRRQNAFDIRGLRVENRRTQDRRQPASALRLAQ